MTTVTDSDITELKELIKGLDLKIESVKTEMTTVRNELSAVKIEIAEVKSELKSTNTKIEALEKQITKELSSQEKRISNQEFFTRSVIVGLITILSAPIAGLAIRYFFENPIFQIAH